MSGSKCRVFGISAFGLLDSVFERNTPVKGLLSDELSMTPTSVILSDRGPFIIGDEATFSRIESGLYWPPEAHLPQEGDLCRVPVCLAWDRLVSAGDSLSLWKAESLSRSYPTGMILQRHMHALLQKAGWKPGDKAVLAIPDALDEMGQEAILSAFGERREDIMLVWRPIAAALSWLRQAQKECLQDIQEKDWLLVIYAGADSWEMSGFRLKRNENGLNGILPVRSRPPHQRLVSGIDWARNVCNTDCTKEERWQILHFPETWKALKYSKADATPRELNLGGSSNRAENGRWIFWSASQDIKILSGESLLHASPWLDGQRGMSDSSSLLEGETWNSYVRNRISEIINRFDGRNPFSIILCGPLAPKTFPDWMRSSAVSFMTVGYMPQRDCIWLAEDGLTDDDIAFGAGLYGRRTIDGLPSYLDTLPRLDIMAQTNGQSQWQPLVDEAECIGGQEYKNSVSGFSYMANQGELQAFLRKEGNQEYRQEIVRLEYIPEENVPIDIQVSMRPASGLATVRLVAKDACMEDLFFDFSKMEKIGEEKIPQNTSAVFCPETGHIDLYKDYSPVKEENFCIKCNDFCMIKNKFSKQSLKFFKGCLKPAGRNYINEYGESDKDFVNEHINKMINVINIDYKKLNRELYSNIDDVALKFSFLWAKTPDYIVRYIEKEVANGNLSKYIVPAAGRCFTQEKQFKLFFNKILKKYNDTGKLSSIDMSALFNILNYRKDSWKSLDYSFVTSIKDAILKIMEDNRLNKKVKFRNAASIIFVLLKFRKHDGHYNFLKDSKEKKIFEIYIQEIQKELKYKNIDKRRRNNLEKTLKYMEDILKFIKYTGDRSILPVFDEEVKE